MSLPRNALAVATASQSALGVCVCVLCVGFECWMHRDRTAPASPVDLELVACAAGASGDKCDESKWPDKDKGLVCSDCKVLVDKFDSKYKDCNGSYLQKLRIGVAEN